MACAVGRTPRLRAKVAMPHKFSCITSRQSQYPGKILFRDQSVRTSNSRFVHLRMYLPAPLPHIEVGLSLRTCYQPAFRQVLPLQQSLPLRMLERNLPALHDSASLRFFSTSSMQLTGNSPFRFTSARGFVADMDGSRWKPGPPVLQATPRLISSLACKHVAGRMCGCMSLS